MKRGRVCMVSLLSFALVSGVYAQRMKEGYVDRGIVGSAFPKALLNWNKGDRWTDDDNFFISRVRPKERFRNISTQVNRGFDKENDKNLLFWVPMNDNAFNALPDGVFDSEVFSMWQYVTHFGNWSAPMVRMPGGLVDVAHKNGVPVSVVASIPYGRIPDSWRESLETLVEAGPEKLADYLSFYGVDGIGYNSEFFGASWVVGDLCHLHEETRKIMQSKGNCHSDFVWYDGTNIDGYITFDRGLDDHNAPVWGSGDSIRSILFLNYEWNSTPLLEKTVERARKMGRSPLDLYCGINMQGMEPDLRYGVWDLLSEWPLSIGLWGAHTRNMFFEGRGEKGASARACQVNYQKSVENWFSGGNRNPAATPPIANTLVCSSDNPGFPGMASLMSARSALSWNLSEEPFITYFNLGNGRFFNYKGLRQHDSEWYNISMQDYLPTWRWWLADSFLGRDESASHAGGLEASFVWDDAWMGGSCIRIAGSASDQFIHLFKTEFPLERGDEVTLRYKLMDGSSDLDLALSMKGRETVCIGRGSLSVMESTKPVPGHWVEKRFVIGTDIPYTPQDTLAMIALHFKDASSLDMRLGELSVVRRKDMPASVATPFIERTEVLYADKDGVDGKIIFGMPNDKGDDVCYNSDVDVSMFKLYCQGENDASPVLMGMTTSWAGLIFGAPCSDDGKGRVRFGVSALGLDHVAESDIAWGRYLDVRPVYKIDDSVVLSEPLITPDKSFDVSYTDLSHEPADWTITDSSGKVVASESDRRMMELPDGLPLPGTYNLVVDGVGEDGEERVRKAREFPGLINVIDPEKCSLPVITSVEATNAVSSDEEGEIRAFSFDSFEAKFKFTADYTIPHVSRGLRIGKDAFGFRFSDSGLDARKSFSVSFWFKPDCLTGKTMQMLNIRDKGDAWPFNNYGWFRHILDADGSLGDCVIRLGNGTSATLHFGGTRLQPGIWYHFTYVFEYDQSGGIMPRLYLNGKKQEIVSWTDGYDQAEGEPVELGAPGIFNEGYVLAVGGHIHANGSAEGVIDDFMLWDRALDEDGVRLTMKDSDHRSLQGVRAAFDFESEPESDFRFKSLVSSSLRAGAHGYVPTETEGQGVIEWNLPEYSAGCPYVGGDAFAVDANVSWSAPGCAIVSSVMTPGEGLATVRVADRLLTDSYPDGFSLRLTVSNEYGSDSADMILRFPSSVAPLAADADLDVFPVIFEDRLGVRANEDGFLNICLMSLDGRRILANSFNANVGDELNIYPDVPSGMYVVVVEKEGKRIGMRKVMRK